MFAHDTEVYSLRMRQNTVNISIECDFRKALTHNPSIRNTRIKKVCKHY